MARKELKHWTYSVVGISLGCLLGMVPLLFSHPEKKVREKVANESPH